MKFLFTILLSFLFGASFAHTPTFGKLCEVNRYWTQQAANGQCDLPAYTSMSENEWIRLHLMLVERRLRDRSTVGLSDAGKANRLKRLDDLHAYWQAGNFPQNEDYAYRTPIFIDKHDNFCAVGYLVKASGNEKVSRMIASADNLAYARDMRFPELSAWASDNGFTIDELAWIQPTYPPKVYSSPVGKGVDGEVKEMFVDTIANRLFVGGSFTTADGSIAAANIAYVTGAPPSFTWHSVGAGVNGPVNAIVTYTGNVFAAGSFSSAGGAPADNVAYWDGTDWHSAGCLTGVVNNIAVFRGDLYAAGAFSVCGGTPGANFAKWDGTNWQELPGLAGHINTMRVMDTVLLLGGAFSYGIDTVNAIKWNSASGFMPFTTKINNEVNAFGSYNDSMYAACYDTGSAHNPDLLLRLRADDWIPVFDSTYFTGFALSTPRVFKTLCSDAVSLNIGGSFYYAPRIGTVATNCFNISSPLYEGTGHWFNVDDEIEKLVLFNGDLFAGGKFKIGTNGEVETVTLNGIAVKHMPGLSVAIAAAGGSCDVYPNPAIAAHTLTITNDFNATRFQLFDMNSKLLTSGSLSGRSARDVKLPLLPAGTYQLRAMNEQGTVATRRVVIR